MEQRRKRKSDVKKVYKRIRTDKKAKRMKSIKEKAKENLEQNKDEILYVYDRYAGFVDGANYVLECFESILSFVAKKGIIYGKIKETIEQLKK